jgi:hypothetical protein
MWSCKSKIVPGFHLAFSSFFREMAWANRLDGNAVYPYINRKKTAVKKGSRITDHNALTIFLNVKFRILLT